MNSRMAGQTAYCSSCHKPLIVPGTPPQHPLDLRYQAAPKTPHPPPRKSTTTDKVINATCLLFIGLYVIGGLASGVWWNHQIEASAIVTFLFIVGLLLYLIPTFIARARNHKNKTAITALNIVAGWTFAGWVVALVWALKND